MSVKRPCAADQEVGRRIRMNRLQKGLSQTALANHLGITFQQVQKYERGVNRVGAGRLQKIAEVFGIPVASFFVEGDAIEQDASAVTLLQTGAQLRMAKAFAGIKSQTMRQHLLALAEEMAA